MNSHRTPPSDGHGHAHAHDRGVKAAFRYLLLLPELWRSAVSEAAVRAAAPKAGERVVDLGAGMGAAAFEAARTGARVTAVDPAPYMRAVLRLRRLWPGRSNVAVADGAAESIPLPDGGADALWTVNTVHHWTDRARAARELARVLRPGGRLLLVDEDMAHPDHPWHARWTRRKHRFDDVDPEALAAALAEAGFASARGARTTFAGRPAKLVEALR